MPAQPGLDVGPGLPRVAGVDDRLHIAQHRAQATLQVVFDVGDQVLHAFSDEHKAELTGELTRGNRKAENLQWVRFKGLGEMDVEELAVTCLDPGTRILRRITMDDAESAGDAAVLHKSDDGYVLELDDWEFAE